MTLDIQSYGSPFNIHQIDNDTLTLPLTIFLLMYQKRYTIHMQTRSTVSVIMRPEYGRVLTWFCSRERETAYSCECRLLFLALAEQNTRAETRPRNVN
jgi:hypothetical protein